MEMLREQILNLVVIVGTGVIGLVGASAVYFLNKATANMKAKTEAIKDKNAKILVDSAIDNLSMLVRDNVIKAQETTVKEILAGAEDGTFTKEDLKQVAVSVRENVLLQIPNSAADILSTSIGDLGLYIEAEIEKQLAILKGKDYLINSAANNGLTKINLDGIVVTNGNSISSQIEQSYKAAL